MNEKEREAIPSFLKVFQGISEWVYGIDPDTHTLLYLNDSAKKMLPQDCLGEPCYRVIRGLPCSCADCPMQKFQPGETVDALVYSRLLDCRMKIHVSSLTGENGQRICLIVTQEPAKTREEMEYQKQKSKLDTVLQENCEYVMMVDISTRKYLCRLTEHRKVTFSSGDYTVFMDNYMNAHILPKKRPRYQEAFAFETLLERVKHATEPHMISFTTYDVEKGLRHHSSMVTMETDEKGKAFLILCTRDITELHEAEKRMSSRMLEHQKLRSQQHMRMANERYRVILEQTGTIDWEYDISTDTSYISPLLYERFEVLHNPINLRQSICENLRIYELDLPLVEELRQEMRDGKPHHEAICRFYGKAGNIFWCRLTINKIFDREGQLVRFYGTLQDVDKETKAMEALRYRADYDSLTHLPNADLFYRNIRAAFQEKPDGRFAILLFDIDKFRVVNDLYGKQYGDEALCLVANVIRRGMGEINRCCRMYADHFGIFMEYTDENEIVAFLQALQKEVSCHSHGVDLSMSFGVYCVVDQSVSIESMCDWANLAKKQAKGNRIRPIAFYDDAMRDCVLRDRRIENQMQAALYQGQFQMFLQPKVDIATSKITGAEALVRWDHPNHGMIMPDIFIPLFERNGFIFQLDLFMMRQACETLRKWIDSGRQPVPISVNLSRVHAFRPDLVSILSGLIEEYQIPRSFLELEVTENMLFQNTHEIYDMMIALKRAGFSISMDDFGSGYSSLNMLKDMPVDVIKLDRAFFNKAMSTERERTVIRSIISMVNQLHLGVVAEGVETAEQARFLLEADCKTAQGYYYYRPMQLQEFEQVCFGEARRSS